MLLQGIFFLLCIELFLAAKITEISVPGGELHVREGSRLIIPCLFRVESSTSESKVDLEWGIRSGPDNGYRSIIHMYGNILEPVNLLNRRAQVFVSHLPNGDCSLFIDPIIASDSGTYELHLRIDEKLYQPIPTLQIIVCRRLGFLSTNHGFHKKSSSEEPKSRSLSNIRNELGNAVPDAKASLVLARAIQYLKRNGNLLYVQIAGGLIVGLLILGSLAGLIFGCLYLWRQQRFWYQIKEKTEGLKTSGYVTEEE
uniref:Immunoglobulin V-set domain-containing protein n=1 Tax=Pyxicephalus adspersus TaxID=30357 RepID=A0AAV3AZG9_PYXAD|nr:TPA: hypothetical protein GDO54_001965 [Pyxicephalus adspersus]